MIISQKNINALVLLFTLSLTTCANFQALKNNNPQQVIDKFMYLISKKMDFSQLISLGDYPHTDSLDELNFYLLEMRKLFPNEEYLRNHKNECNKFEKKFKHYYSTHQLPNYINFKQDKQNCINEMNQIGNKVISQVYNLTSGIKFISSTYNANNTEVILEYRTKNDNRKIKFPLIKKNDQWYFRDFSYEYIVNRLGYL